MWFNNNNYQYSNNHEVLFIYAILKSVSDEITYQWYQACHFSSTNGLAERVQPFKNNLKIVEDGNLQSKLSGSSSGTVLLNVWPIAHFILHQSFQHYQQFLLFLSVLTHSIISLHVHTIQSPTLTCCNKFNLPLPRPLIQCDLATGLVELSSITELLN